MFIRTRHFGEIEVDEKMIIEFKEGIPGFEDLKKYVLLDTGDEDSPFKWLQCVDEPQLAFAIIDPFVVKKDYEFDLDIETVKKLEIEKEQDALIYSIVVIPEDISKTSMNLKAPLVINTEKNKGMQVVLNNDRYSVRHYIREELQGQEVSENACFDKEER